jgi:hypothetical protein
MDYISYFTPTLKILWFYTYNFMLSKKTPAAAKAAGGRETPPPLGIIFCSKSANLWHLNVTHDLYM